MRERNNLHKPSIMKCSFIYSAVDFAEDMISRDKFCQAINVGTDFEKYVDKFHKLRKSIIKIYDTNTLVNSVELIKDELYQIRRELMKLFP